MRNISVFVLVRDIGGLCNLEIYLELPWARMLYCRRLWTGARITASSSDFPLDSAGRRRSARKLRYATPSTFRVAVRWCLVRRRTPRESLCGSFPYDAAISSAQPEILAKVVRFLGPAAATM